VTQEGDGGFAAECLSHDIFTQGDSWEQLRANVREAVNGYFFDQTTPSACTWCAMKCWRWDEAPA
jgi:hypothetical protein